MKRKAVSLLLVICMITALLPANLIVYADSTDSVGSAYTFVYTFNMDSTSKGDLINTTTYADTCNMWEWSEQTTSGMSQTTTHASSGIQTSLKNHDENEFLALNINIPYAGTYKISLVRSTSNTMGGYGNVYLFPKGTVVSDVIHNAEPLNSEEISCHTLPTSIVPGSPLTLTEGFEVTEETKGEWILVFRTTRDGEGSIVGEVDGKEGCRMYLNSLTLEGTPDGADNYAVTRVVPSNTNIELEEGMFENVIVSAYLSSSKPATDADCELSYNIPEKYQEIATVDSKGTVIAHKEGNATLTVTARKGTSVATCDVNIAVRKAGTSGYLTKYDFTNTAVAGFENTLYKDTNNFWQFKERGLDWAAVEINTPLDGKHNLELDFASPADAEGSMVYILPADTENISAALESTNPVGTVSYSEHRNTVFIGEYNFEEDKYIIVFRAKAGGSVQIPAAFSLNGGVNAALFSIKVDEEGGFVNVVSGVMSDGSEANLENADVSWSVDDLSVGAVDEATGEVISSLNGGTTTVRATVTLGSVSVTDEVEVTLAPGLPASGAKDTYTFYKYHADWLEDGCLNMHPQLTTVSIWGIPQKYAGGNNWEWFEHQNVAEKPQNAAIYTKKNAVRLVAGNGQWYAIKIWVPESGLYWPTLMSRINDQGTTSADIYIMSADKDKSGVTAAINNSEPLGTVNFKPGGAAADVSQNLLSVNLKQGWNIIVFHTPVKGNSFPSSLILDGEVSLRVVNLNLDKSVYEVGDEAATEFSAMLNDGTILRDDEITVIYGTDNEKIATFENGVVKAKGRGTTDVHISVTHNGKTVTAKKTITVNDTSGVKTLDVEAGDKSAYVGERVELSTVVFFNRENDGKNSTMTLNNTKVDYQIENDESGKARLLAGGYLTVPAPIDEDYVIVEVSARAFIDGEEHISPAAQIVFNKGTLKEEPTYYTYDRRNAAANNIKKYDWAAEERDRVLGYCKTYLNGWEDLYNAITLEGIPRSNRVGETSDTYYSKCRYCAEEIGSYDINVYARPWKVQCPDCKRLFPSNDFESFYKLGLDETGAFNREKALIENGKLCGTIAQDGTILNEKNPYGYGMERGFLYNQYYHELYTEGGELYGIDPFYYNADLDNVKGPDHVEVPITNGWNVEIEEQGKLWGVDDGLGYHTGRKYASQLTERHTYIAHYINTAWVEIHHAIKWLSIAYVYTNDTKYGIPAAILLDRVADVYPSFSFKQWWNEFYKFAMSHGGSGFGKIYGRINDCEYATDFIKAADALYPLLLENNSTVINYLSEKATIDGFKNTYGNEKKSGAEIWKNWEDNIIREAFTAAKAGNIFGNFGQSQKAIAFAALVLDKEPESKQMVEWVFQPGGYSVEGNNAVQTGGNLSVKLIDEVDRDGMGNEASPNYNLGWIDDLYECAEALDLYTSDEEYNLYKNPKFAKMYTAGIPLTLTNSHTAQIGDTGSTAGLSIELSDETLARGFYDLKNTNLGNQFAEYLYRKNGYSVEDLHYDIYTINPTSIQSDILERIDDDVRDYSEMMPAYGFAVIRDGAQYGDVGTPTYKNNMRDFWIYFGRNAGHGHYDTLNLGIEAFGLNMAPDNGTPKSKDNNPRRFQWVEPTISHNTVTVDAQRQGDVGLHGFPQHFDDSGEVKLMDVDASRVYEDTSIYRRTVVMINAGSDVSYGVDFFRIKGGSEHIYSFHSQSNEIYKTDGIDESKIQHQKDENDKYVGSYAGKDVAWGEDPCNSYVESAYEYPAGYTWMGNVRRAQADALVGDAFSVDFKVTDFNNAVWDSKGLHLRMTMLNDDFSEVAFTSGTVIDSTANRKLPESLEYVLVKSEPQNGETLYTTVFEPYKNSPYLSSMEEVVITPAGEDEAKLDANDTARAIKVTHTDGRVDYIVYATNNDVIYTATDGDFSFEFRGFVGVLSLDEEDGDVIYSYVNDGDILRKVGSDEQHDYKAYTGMVSDYTHDLSFENSITLSTDAVFTEEMVESLSGQYVYIENGSSEQNAVYKIESAEYDADNKKLNLNIGGVTTIKRLKDSTDASNGYIFNVAIGQKAVIPISNVEDYGPRFTAESYSEATTTAGNTFTRNASATARDDIGGKLTYSATSGEDIPRGASIDSATGKIMWKPDDSQIGKHNFAITVRDELGRGETVNFIVTVYGRTTGSDTSTEDDSVGGGGGGGGAVPLPDDDTDNDTPDTGDESGDNTGTGTENGNLRFIDLASHAWAADAINALAEAGVIKGTSENEYSPSKNITRADYAILLVRAFNQTSDNAENFDDVKASDYFANELAIARNTGIVSGIGNNMFAPRKNIMRQDMMLMTYRALKARGIELEVGKVDAPDLDKVDGYALDAVRALISNGLVNGKNGYIDPKAYTTRAEVAVLIKRIMDYVK